MALAAAGAWTWAGTGAWAWAWAPPRHSPGHGHTRRSSPGRAAAGRAPPHPTVHGGPAHGWAPARSQPPTPKMPTPLLGSIYCRHFGVGCCTANRVRACAVSHRNLSAHLRRRARDFNRGDSRSRLYFCTILLLLLLLLGGNPRVYLAQFLAGGLGELIFVSIHWCNINHAFQLTLGMQEKISKGLKNCFLPF